MMSNIYRDEILEHYREPQNFGKLSQFDTSSKQLNPFCGDEIEMFVSFHAEKIAEISFTGKGCAISIASASILTDFAKGKTKKELTEFTDADMLDLLAIEVSETRKKCALLALAVMKDCL
jgi:nitrogen fixation NifU-like protein